jgi:hypothetical protein
MSLVAEIIGVLAAGTAIALFLGRSASSRPRASAGVAVAVVAVASLLFFENGWSMISAYPAATNADQGIPKAVAETLAGGSTNIGFLAWARSEMVSAGQRPSFMLIPETVRHDALIYQWSTYQLVPAFETEDPARADWLVFYDVDPQNVPYDRARFTRLSVYSPGFAVAERTRVG